MAGYYRRFVPNFGLISKPLTSLLKKGVLFLWTSVTESSFQALKQALITAPVLALPDFSQTFVVETDASAKEIGAVLQQQGHPVAYASKALGKKAQCLSTYEKECLAILMTVDQWCHYLQTAPFIILTDQQSLTHLDDQWLSTPWQHKALTKLMGLTYKIIYKKGCDNKVADALSRAQHSTSYQSLPCQLSNQCGSRKFRTHIIKILKLPISCPNYLSHQLLVFILCKMDSSGTRVDYGLVTTLPYTPKSILACILVL